MLALVHPADVALNAGHRSATPSSSSATPALAAPSSSRRPPSGPTLASSASTSSARPSVHLQINPSTSTPPLPTTPPHSSPTPVNIHTYPTPDLLRLLASLLTQIAATNDALASHSASPTSPTVAYAFQHPQHGHTTTSPTSSTASLSQSHLQPNHHSALWPSLTTASRVALSTPSSTLTFHARNIPTISLESYLLRIIKYCPTTNEVFLSLLVYFDRMSKLSADAVGRSFVIDSYNIHRLVIAGVTVASKFFSDVFYTNSRYAKVGGLPLTELNQLELQFLLLNDFRLVISTAEMQRYAEQLILFSTSSSSNAPPASTASTSLRDPVIVPTTPTSAATASNTHTVTAPLPQQRARVSATDASRPQHQAHIHFQQPAAANVYLHTAPHEPKTPNARAAAALPATASSSSVPRHVRSPPPVKHRQYIYGQQDGQHRGLGYHTSREHDGGTLGTFTSFHILPDKSSFRDAPSSSEHAISTPVIAPANVQVGVNGRAVPKETSQFRRDGARPRRLHNNHEDREGDDQDEECIEDEDDEEEDEDDELGTEASETENETETETEAETETTDDEPTIRAYDHRHGRSVSGSVISVSPPLGAADDSERERETDHEREVKAEGNSRGVDMGMAVMRGDDEGCGNGENDCADDESGAGNGNRREGVEGSKTPGPAPSDFAGVLLSSPTRGRRRRRTSSAVGSKTLKRTLIMEEARKDGYDSEGQEAALVLAQTETDAGMGQQNGHGQMGDEDSVMMSP